MINTVFKRLNESFICDGCGAVIEAEAPAFNLNFENSSIGEITLTICEDCGNNLQNDMADEYVEFVDLCK